MAFMVMDPAGEEPAGAISGTVVFLPGSGRNLVSGRLAKCWTVDVNNS
jgi:hypothetical protein